MTIPTLTSLLQTLRSLSKLQLIVLSICGLVIVGGGTTGAILVSNYNKDAATEQTVGQDIANGGTGSDYVRLPDGNTTKDADKKVGNKSPSASPTPGTQSTTSGSTGGTNKPASPSPSPSTSPSPSPSPSPTPTPPAPSPTGCQPVAKTGGGTWNCTWSDEFSGTSLDRDIWSVIPYGLGNTCQSDDSDHVKVTGGYLQLLATKNAANSWCKQTWDLDYTGGFIQSLGGFSQKYGRFEMRAKLPAGDGYWPAFWLLPASDSYNAEIDVLEAYGGRDNNIGDATLHTPAGGPGPQENCAINPNYTDAYHLYTMEWKQGNIKVFYDNVLCANFTGLGSEFDQSFHILLDLAVQPWWPPNGSTPFPGIFSIDYVRVWQ